MDLTSPTTIKQIMAQHEAMPSKGLGQNFLTDKKILEKIVEAAGLKKDELVLEVGPGIGTLTKELAQRVGRVIAVEKDRKMMEILGHTLAEFKNVKIIEDDILRILPPKKYKLVANIPYYLTSPLIRKFLEEASQPEEMVLMVQKEVAQRICAKPPEMSLLAVSVQFYATAKIVSYVSKNCFWPAPKVDSAIIKIIPHAPAGEAGKKYDVDPDLFFRVVKAGFSHPRKQLVNNLAVLKNLNGVKLDKYKTAEWLLKNGLKPNQRSETLSVSDWVNLVKSF